MTLTARVLTSVVRGILRILCKVDGKELNSIPAKGPLLIIVNHINFLEVPIISTRLLPREFYGLTKQETWNNPFFRILADNWGGIPINRSNPAITTMRTAEKVLKEDNILFIAPEGTRSSDGKLRQGNSGIASIAIRTNTTILPVAHFGGEDFWQNIKKFRRTRITIKVGTPIKINSNQPLTKQFKRDVTDQLMYEIANLLPMKNRGLYTESREFEKHYLTKP
jgi:1-acyl-sn-glycerol-3-phosphate acyltransferase